jgi:hypothetical protein
MLKKLIGKARKKVYFNPFQSKMSNSTEDSSRSDPELEEVQDQEKLTSDFDISQLPASFKKFLEENDIDPEIYTVAQLPRYIRTNTHLPVEKRPTLQQLSDQFGTDQVFAVSGLEDFFSVQLSDTTKRISDIPA